MQLQIVDKADTPQIPAFSDEQKHAMQKAMVRLFDQWGLTDAEAAILLGDIATRTWQRWKDEQFGRVGIDLATRMSNLLGIHKALRLLYTEKQRGYRWIQAPNRAFDGATPLEVMLQGRLTDLMRVRRYLDSYRGAW